MSLQKLSCGIKGVSAGLSLSCKTGTCDARRSSVRGGGGLSPGLPALESEGTNLQSSHSCTSPSLRLDSASRLGIQSPTILHRPSHNALHSPLPALQLAFPPLRRRSPRPPATSNTPELPQRRALTWRPVHCGLLRASFNSAHDATSTLAAVFGALASLPPDPAERGAMLCRTSYQQWHQQSKLSDWHIQPIWQISPALYQRLVTPSGRGNEDGRLE